MTNYDDPNWLCIHKRINHTCPECWPPMSDDKALEIATELLEWSSQLSWDDHGLDEIDTKGFISFITKRIAAALAEELQVAKDGIMADMKALRDESQRCLNLYLSGSEEYGDSDDNLCREGRIEAYKNVLAILDKWLGGIQR